MVLELRSSRLRVYFGLLLALSLAFTLYEELHLRRVLYQHGGAWAVIAGSLPNFLAVPIVSFAVMLVRERINDAEIVRTIGAVAVGLTLYEAAQIWMPGRVFDWKDIAASVLGGMFSWVLIAVPRMLFKTGIAENG